MEQEWLASARTQFVLALIDPAAYRAAYPTCNINRADMNADTLIDGLDTQQFVAALLGICPPWSINCGGVCMIPTSDPNNCGGCGVQCGPSEACINGFCESG